MPGVVLDDPAHGVGGGELELPGLAQEHDAKRVVQLGVGQDDALDRDVADPGRRGRGQSRPSWSRTSGEALSRNQRSPSALTAAEDWLRGTARRGSERATRQEGHQQFHWGKPPPAAVPRRTTCTGRGAKAEGPAFASPSDQLFA